MPDSSKRAPVVAAALVAAALAVGIAVGVSDDVATPVPGVPDAGAVRPEIPEYCLPCGCHCTDQSEP